MRKSLVILSSVAAILSYAAIADTTLMRYSVGNISNVDIETGTNNKPAPVVSLVENSDGSFKAADDQGNDIAMESCQQYVDEGLAAGNGSYVVSGSKVVCEMTRDGGGWTRIARVLSNHQDVSYNNFSDGGRDYTEMLFVNHDSNAYVDYAHPNNYGNWRTHGFGLDRFLLKTNAGVRALPWSGSRACGSNNAYTEFTEANFRVLKQNPKNYCYSYDNNYPQMCVDEFVVTMDEGMRPYQVTDVESQRGCNGDNIIGRNYSIYVR